MPSLSLATAPASASVQSDATERTTPRAPSSTEPADRGASQAGAIAAARELDRLVDSGDVAQDLTDALRNGFDEQAARGGVIDANSDDGGGTFGTARIHLGPDGWGASSGTGGGGEGWGTIGTGRYATIGHGQGTGDGYGFAGGAEGVGGVRVRQTGAPSVGLGAAKVFGDRDKGIIRRYITRHLAELEYCYERERVQRHELAGELELEFVISSSGRVRGSHAAGFDDRVGSCVADVASHIEFPAVKDAGATEVHYPLRFEGR